MFLYFKKSEHLVELFHLFPGKIFFCCSDFLPHNSLWDRLNLSVALTENTLSFNNIFVVNLLPCVFVGVVNISMVTVSSTNQRRCCYDHHRVVNQHSDWFPHHGSWSVTHLLLPTDVADGGPGGGAGGGAYHRDHALRQDLTHWERKKHKFEWNVVSSCARCFLPVCNDFHILFSENIVTTAL